MAVITLAGLALTLGRILQSLDDLKKKVESSLDPEKGIIRELRERSHAANNRDQELLNRDKMFEQEFAAYKREVAQELSSIRREIRVDEQLTQIKTLLLRSRTPAMGSKTDEG